MLTSYAARYEDRRGQEATTIWNDGEMLRVIVRGVEFAGYHPFSLKPTADPNSPQLVGFVLDPRPRYADELCAYVLEYDVPIPVVAREEVRDAILHVRAEKARPEEGWDACELLLTLSYDGCDYQGGGEEFYFEDALYELQAALPEGVYIKACVNCAFSGASVYGGSRGLGDLRCYRNNKDAFLSIKHKGDFMRLMKNYVEEVQETYLCPEFERRMPGAYGYQP
jgi:hypothetical protein